MCRTDERRWGAAALLVLVVGLALLVCLPAGAAPADSSVRYGLTPSPEPPTQEPPTAVPPTAVAPTAVPPTALPPTGQPPTGVPTAAPTQGGSHGHSGSGDQATTLPNVTAAPTLRPGVQATPLPDYPTQVPYVPAAGELPAGAPPRTLPVTGGAPPMPVVVGLASQVALALARLAGK